MSTRVLVTGGSGFIGSHICEALKVNHRVRVLDVKAPKTEGIDFMNGSVTNPTQSVASAEDCDAVVHLAGVVGVTRTEAARLETLNVNIEGTKNMLEACRVNDSRKMIFSSSSEVYGEPIKVPVSETDSPMPITTYGISKLAAEEYVVSYCLRYGIKYTIVRLFNIYGPCQSTDFVVPRFVKAAAENRPITIYGEGTQVRSFCNIGDATKGIVATLLKGDNEIFNVGNDREPISVRELAEMIVKISNSSSSLHFKEFEKSDRRGRKEIQKRIPNIEKARKMLGYQPSIPLADGILAMTRSLGRSRAQ